MRHRRQIRRLFHWPLSCPPGVTARRFREIPNAPRSKVGGIASFGRHLREANNVYLMIGLIWLTFVESPVNAANSLLAADVQNENAAENDDEPAQFPGIWARYQAGGKQVERREARIQLSNTTSAPDQRLPPGPFQSEWNGRLLVRSPGSYRLHAHFQGRLSLQLAGKTILEVTSSEPDWKSSDEFELPYGEHRIVVQLKSSSTASRLNLYWSSDSFPLEPIPAGAYFLEKPHPEYDLELKGKRLFSAHRCNRCHTRLNDSPSAAAPDLSHTQAGWTKAGLVDWLLNPKVYPSHSRMPQYDFTAAEASSISTFLLSVSRPVEVSSKSVLSDLSEAKRQEAVVAGNALFHSMGCLACHQFQEEIAAVKEGDRNLPFETDAFGGNLAYLGDKRSAEWISQWLLDPSKLNSNHQMPQFTFQVDNKLNEVQQLAAFLSTSQSTGKRAFKPETDGDRSPPEIVDRGRALVEKARCAACHVIPGIKANVNDLPTLEKLPLEFSQSCLSRSTNKSTTTPNFPDADVEALKTYLKSRSEPLSVEGEDERGQRLILSKGCLQCHPRDGTPGLSKHIHLVAETIPALTGVGPALMPPSLTAVGDKLLPEVLLKAVSGDIQQRRLSWMRVRMPRFAHTEEERKALVNLLTRQDLIPELPPQLGHHIPEPTGDLRLPALVAGHTLLGSQGFTCVACHKFGKFEPRNTALGTKGSDLLKIGQRMRRPYFFRWLRSPIRIVPDMEMPAYERPFPGLLNDNLEAQLAALWESLNDPNPTRPLEVASVQQFLSLKANQPARVVRDVFAWNENGTDRYIPRSFAVGFPNRHSVLIDLDRFRLREWWVGDFARQRTEGKSWFWDMAGVPLLGGLGDNHADICLATGSGDLIQVIPPISHQGTTGWLKSYEPVENGGIRLNYRLQFPRSQPSDQQTPDDSTDVDQLEVEVSEVLQPMSHVLQSQNWLGWSRRIEITGLPAAVRAVFLFPEGNLSNILIKPSSPRENDLRLLTPSDPQSPKWLELSESAPQTVNASIDYLSSIVPPSVDVPSRVEIAAERTQYTTVPGFDAAQLPLPRSIMPTSLTFTRRGQLAMTSLKGHVLIAKDQDGDGLQETLQEFEEGLAAPYGIINDVNDDSLIVAHKPEVLKLIDRDADGRADKRIVLATGWGYNENYHDWTCGIVRDSHGNLFVGLGSDYTQPKRPADQLRWRGKILRINPSGQVTPIARGLRYPTGLAINEDDELFASDNQGEQNSFNELNHIVEGANYGVASREDGRLTPITPRAAAIQIPHPWTRSINGIFFLPRNSLSPDPNQPGRIVPHPFAGHGIGCEYDTRYLIRFSLQKVGEVLQGAVYPFSLDQVPPEVPNFEGTLSGTVAPNGDLYIGCIHDSGWLGGQNLGSLVRLRFTGALPLGIRELRVQKSGFVIDMTGPLKRSTAQMASLYSISGYTRKWQGTYATPDSDRHRIAVHEVDVSPDGLQVRLTTDPLKPGYVYEVSCGKIGPDPSVALWPSIGHYTVNRIPDK